MRATNAAEVFTGIAMAVGNAMASDAATAESFKPTEAP